MAVLLRKLLLTRPYSWAGSILVGIMAHVISEGALILDPHLVLDIFAAFIIWVAMLLTSEYFHRKVDGRGFINPVPPIAFFILLAAVLFIGNLWSLLLLPVMFMVNYIYSLKIIDWPLSSLSFMFRGILEICIFIVVMLFHSNYNFSAVLPLLAAIFLVTNSRNLVGDVRDMEFDEYTFPKKHGIEASYFTSLLLLILSILIIWDWVVTLPLIIFAAIMLLWKNAYLLHRIFVISTIFFYANYTLSSLGQNLFILNLLFLAVMLNFTYPLVPRKSNPREGYSYNYKKNNNLHGG